MRLDLHTHSKYSHDALIDPAKLDTILERKGLDGIAITDHGTIKGGMEAKRLMKSKIAIPGVEYRTDIGDIIGLFIQEEIKSREHLEVIDEMHAQGAIVVLPHPFDSFRKPAYTIADKVDAIESFNARCALNSLNEKAAKLAASLGKPQTGGSDAHLSFEIGNGWTEIAGELEGGLELEGIRKALLKGKTKVGGKLTPPFVRPIARATKILKKRRVSK